VGELRHASFKWLREARCVSSFCDDGSRDIAAEKLLLMAERRLNDSDTAIIMMLYPGGPLEWPCPPISNIPRSDDEQE
jgi:hypothetical protein